MIRWLEQVSASEDHVAHGNLHAGDREGHRSGGPGARRAILRRMQRITRNQRDREARELGYADIGGEDGGA